MAKITLGDRALEFALPDAHGNIIRFEPGLEPSSLVLIFYPKDQTPGCTAQLCAARDDAQAYISAGVRVYGLSGDTMASHTRFSTKHKLEMPLLVDEGLRVASRYDAVLRLGSFVLPIINRTVVGISSTGHIDFYQRGAPATATILAALRR